MRPAHALRLCAVHHRCPPLLQVAGHFITSSVTILEQKSGPQFIFGLDMLRRHQCCIDMATNLLRCAAPLAALPRTSAALTRPPTCCGALRRSLLPTAQLNAATHHLPACNMPPPPPRHSPLSHPLVFMVHACLTSVRGPPLPCSFGSVDAAVPFLAEHEIPKDFSVSSP